jgi:hypothetical protein
VPLARTSWPLASSTGCTSGTAPCSSARPGPRRLGLPYGAMTFERHPDAYLRRAPVPPVLTSLSEKLRLFRDAGAQFVVMLPADATVLGIPAEQFARDVLRAETGVRVVVVGKNFRFGHRGRGGVVTIRKLSAQAGVDAVEVGTVELARALLGRPYEVAGPARVLGPSSASVAVSAVLAVPSPGRYVGSFQFHAGLAVEERGGRGQRRRRRRSSSGPVLRRREARGSTAGRPRSRGLREEVVTLSGPAIGTVVLCIARVAGTIRGRA